MKIFTMISRAAHWYIQAVIVPLTPEEEAEFQFIF
jgi:hypothetical protein